MAIKNIFFTLFLCFSFTGLVNGKSECTGKVAKVRPQVFIDAEKQEENFREALAACLIANNCKECSEFKNSMEAVTVSVLTLENHLEALNHNTDGSCKSCEKNETKNLHERLTELLQYAQNVE